MPEAKSLNASAIWTPSLNAAEKPKTKPAENRRVCQQSEAAFERPFYLHDRILPC